MSIYSKLIPPKREIRTFGGFPRSIFGPHRRVGIVQSQRNSVFCNAHRKRFGGILEDHSDVPQREISVAGIAVIQSFDDARCAGIGLYLPVSGNFMTCIGLNRHNRTHKNDA